MSQPKISIIIYNHNAGIYTGRLLKSLSKDKYQNLELIVVDDGSKDTSTEQIKHAVIDNEIRNTHLYHLPKHQGEGSAYNLGLSKASGDYVIFTSAKDEFDENFLTALSTNFINSPSTLALTGVKNGQKQLYCSHTKDRKEHETFKAYVARLKKVDDRLTPIYNKIFSMAVIRERDLTFSTSSTEKFINDYLKAADVEKILTIDKPLYLRNSK